MRFLKLYIPTPNPWRYPSRYPYFLLEGTGKPLTEDEKRQIKRDREAWQPSKIANDLSNVLKNNIGNTLWLQLENPDNYYDSPSERPKPFIAFLENVTIEKLLDQDVEFEQLYVTLSNPILLNRKSIFNEFNYDYETLFKPLNGESYKLNFNTVLKFGVKKKSFWEKLYKKNDS